MSRIYTFLKTKISEKQTDELRTLLPSLKTPDDNKHNHWRRKPSFSWSHHYGDQCVFYLGSWPL